MSKILLSPPSPITKSIARLSVTSDRRLRVFFPEKRDDFKEAIKYLQYRWERDAWYRKGVSAEKMADRGAETIRDLLAEGFCVSCPAEWAEIVQGGNVESEPRRKVWAELENRRFVLHWMYGEDCEAAVKKLKGTRWDGNYWRTVHIHAELYESVLDFAEQHGFFVDQSAHDLIAEVEAELSGAVVLNVAKPVAIAHKPALGKPPVLAIPKSVEIDSDLLDI